MAIEVWMVTAGANAVMAFVYGWIATLMLVALYKGNQWLSNPLATATAAIFVTCTIGHGLHIYHVLLPLAASGDASVAAARVAMSDWRLLAWDFFTAGVAVWYFTLRKRLRLLFEGAALCEDLQQRQQQAQELHDNVVQGLVQAKLALDLGRRDEGARAVAQTLESAKQIITGLLGEGTRPEPGSLRRRRPA
jgi:signal transduction histidine kinase